MPVKFALGLGMILSLGISQLMAAEPNPGKLPDPLTLEYALSLADAPHPDIQLQDARIKSLEADKQGIQDEGGLDVFLDIGAQDTNLERVQIEKSDHVRAGIILRTKLYDFGRTSKRLDSVQELLASEQYTFLDVRTQRRLQILEGYFNVLLADLRFSRYNEAMATAYVDADRARDRREQGQVSDLRVLELETEYQRVRGLRYESENLQRETRAYLAELLNSPEQLPSTLSMPKLEGLSNKLADVEEFQSLALTNNNQINALRAKVQAAEKAVVAARAGDNAALYARLSAHRYEGNTVEGLDRAQDQVYAELFLEIPLLTPNTDSDVAKELAKVYESRARLQKSESQLRQSVLKLWHDIEVLQVRREQMAKLNEFRELSLERSRALYEMEVKADLGDAMVQLTEAQYQVAQTDYQLALALYKMKILTGKLVLDSNDISAPLPAATPQEQL